MRAVTGTVEDNLDSLRFPGRARPSVPPQHASGSEMVVEPGSFGIGRRGIAVVALLFFALALAGCGTSPTASSESHSQGHASTAQPWDDLTGTAREKALVNKAKEEGTLTVYSAYNDEPTMAEAFTKKYGIQVDVYNAKSEAVLQRVVKEHAARKAQNDVLVAPSPDMQVVQNKGALQQYTSEYREAISKRGKGDQWTGVRRLAFVTGWNTDAVDPAEIPTDYSGFAKSGWDGRISMEIDDVDWYAGVRGYYLDKGMSPREVQDMFEAIAKNARAVKGHTAQGDLMAAGQFDVGLSLYSQTVEELTDRSAPASYGAEKGHIVAPVVVRYDAGGVMKGTDNPAGAALYLDFELSKDGFAVDKSLGALAPIPQPGEALKKAEIVELDVPAYVRHRSDLTREYDKLISSARRSH